MEPRSPGQIAYDGYFKKCGGRSLISGAELPAWEAQSEAIREAWEAAAQALSDFYAPEDVEGMVIVPRIVGCARCGGTHSDVDFRPMAQPFAPPEAGGLEWTHFARCPVNGDPILLIVAAEDAGDRAS